MPINDDPRAKRVDEFETATCPECENRFGIHLDGRCPHCDTTMEFAPDYAALLVAGFEGIVRQHAARHAPDATTGYPVCAMCAETTPLALENASDVPKAEAVDEVIADAEAAIEALGDDPHWVRGELVDAYLAAYREACADPAACEVCREAAAAADDFVCGHDRAGDPCPAR